MGGTKEAALNPGGRGGAPATSVLRFVGIRLPHDWRHVVLVVLLFVLLLVPVAN
jgi:hypothetical protein